MADTVKRFAICGSTRILGWFDGNFHPIGRLYSWEIDEAFDIIEREFGADFGTVAPRANGREDST